MKKKNNEVKKNILSASKRLFLKKGLDNTSMREIAECSSCSLSNIYTYFHGKVDIFREIFDEERFFFNEFMDFFLIESVFQHDHKIFDDRFYWITREKKIFTFLLKNIRITVFADRFIIKTCQKKYISGPENVLFRNIVEGEFGKTVEIIAGILSKTELSDKEVVEAFVNIILFRREGWKAIFDKGCFK